MKTHIHYLALLAASLLISSPLQAEPPVKVYIMAGQSNMQGKGGIEGEDGGNLRSIVKNHPKEYGFLVDDKGEWIERKDVWAYLDIAPYSPIHSGMKPGFGSHPGHVGPEIGFGPKIGEIHDQQVLVIKACWGGKSVGHDFLPPSIGKYDMPMKPGDPGFYYHEILRIVKDVTENIGTFFPDYKGQGVEIAGICWHQGYNDQFGGMDLKYEENLAAFIKDIRSVEHGLGVPGLPFVIATSGMIKAESPVVQGQIAIGDFEKYPEFKGNVAVFDSHQPYGPEKMTFKFDKDDKATEKVSYHWNNNARSYTNIGIAMAAEMQALKQPESPARFRAHGSEKGVQLLWQLGTEKPKGIEILRNGKSIGAKLPPTQTAFVDTAALPGANSYELILDMPSGKMKFSASCDSSPTNLTAYRSLEGVMLSWEARGKYDAFKISRDGKVIAGAVAADARSFEDKTAPAKGNVVYAVEPSTGQVTPAELTVNLGPTNAGGALVYEPFNYPTDAKEPVSPLGMAGALGTTGNYFSLDEKPKHLPSIVAGGLSHGALPVAGNSIQAHKWSKGFAIELDDSLKKAGLLKDGAEMWISFLFYTHQDGGNVNISLQSADGKEAIGFNYKGVTESYVLENGEEKKRLLVKGMRSARTYLFVAKMVWGKDGASDQWIPYFVREDLKLPKKPGRLFTEPFNIDQSKLSRLVLKGDRPSNADEIRVGPTFESVIGQGN